MFLVFSEVEVNGGKYVSLSDIPVECGDEEPSSEVIPRDVRSDSVPYLQRDVMTGRSFPVMGLTAGEIVPMTRLKGRTGLLS